MNLNEAIELIAFENKISSPQLWLDLGCGTGLFTLALANCLPKNSKIIAIDKNEKALRQLPANANDVLIETRTADFIYDALDIKNADGILMANSLHYVKDKNILLQKLTRLMKTNSRFLIVEYDRTTANQWVPYPLTIESAKALFEAAGYPDFYVLNKRPSVFGGRIMYAALISRTATHH